jgi:hypothetical protein
MPAGMSDFGGVFFGKSSAPELNNQPLENNPGIPVCSTPKKHTLIETGPTDEIFPVRKDGQLVREGRIAVWSSKYGKAKSFRIGGQLYVQFPGQEEARATRTGEGRRARKRSFPFATHELPKHESRLRSPRIPDCPWAR